MTLRYTPEAIQDLKEIQAYIAGVLQNPAAAARMIRRIMHECGQLAALPFSGVSLEKKTGFPTDLQLLVCGNYLALYRVAGDTVSIARVLDGRQDYLRILLREE